MGLKKIQQKPCEYKRNPQNRQYFVWNKYGRSININDKNKNNMCQCGFLSI